jgi:pimeloyl-ACP methyl ester carboxylesterase
LEARKANGDALGKQVKLIAAHAKPITLPNTGHWLMEERPEETMNALIRFLGSTVYSKAASLGYFHK